MLNEIPQHCINQEYAMYSVDSISQEVAENLFEGVNLNYLFSAKPDGEWSVALESDSSLLTIGVAQLITTESYLAMSKEEWKSELQQKGTYSLVTSGLMIQFIFHDFRSNVVFTIEQVSEGEATISYIQQDDCEFLAIDYQLSVANDSLSHEIEGQLLSAIPKK